MLTYDVPSTYLDAFSEFALVDVVENPLIILELEICSTEWNSEQNITVPIGNLKRFAQPQDLEDLKLNPAICSQSTLYFPNRSSSTIGAINFGKRRGNLIDLQVSGSCTDMDGSLVFDVQETLPLQIAIRIAGYPNDFRGMSIASRLNEIRSCFDSLYESADYDLCENVIDPDEKSMEIFFTPKRV